MKDLEGFIPIKHLIFCKGTNIFAGQTFQVSAS